VADRCARVGGGTGVGAIACQAENKIYVAALLNGRIQKLILRPPRTKTAER
jgi:hypothetical protein